MVEKKRHWLLTCWLLFLILMDALRAWYCFAYLPVDIRAHYSNIPDWYSYSLGFVFLGNIFCIYGLFKWSIWGFWGYCLLKIIEIFLKITFHIDTTGHLLFVQAIFLLILLFVLNIGGDKKAWKQLNY